MAQNSSSLIGFELKILKLFFGKDENLSKRFQELNEQINIIITDQSVIFILYDGYDMI